MRIYQKLLILLFVITLLFIFSFFFYQKNKENAFVTFLAVAQKEKLNEFDRLLQLKGQTLELLVSDYTYWDEMVQFVNRQRDETWAQQNIDTVLGDFKVNAVWVYANDLSLVHQINNLGSPFFDIIPFSPEKFKTLFATSHFCHFFIKTPKGIMEIRGATVHTSADKARVKPGQGFFFAGRLWDKHFLEEMEHLVGGKIELVPFKTLFNKLEQGSAATDMLILKKVFYDIDNLPLIRLTVLIKSDILPLLRHMFQEELRLAIVLVVMIMILVFGLVIHWIHTPLWSISDTLHKGDVRYVDNLQTAQNEFGDVARLIAAFFKQKEALLKEIDERKKAEEALRLTQFSVDHAADSVLWIDPRSRIVYVNESACRLLGYTKQELFERMIGEIDVNYQVEKWTQLWGEIKHRQFFTLESRQRTKEGVVFPVEMTMNYLEFNGQEYAYAFVRDITERKKTEHMLEEHRSALEHANEELQKNEKALKGLYQDLKNAYDQLQKTQNELLQSGKMAAIGQLSVGLAHEIKNPLAIITQSVEVVDRLFARSGGEGRQFVQMISNAAMRANKVVSQLLAFSRSSKLELKPVSVHEAIENAMLLVKSKIKVDNIIIGYQFDETIPMVLADKILLEQVFFNLLDNAVDAIPEKGRINVKTQIVLNPEKKEENRVVIEIADTGLGFSPESLEHIFEPFFTTKEEGRGTGLGLSMSYLILQRHGGKIAVESSQGKGTTFSITLPLLINEST